MKKEYENIFASMIEHHNSETVPFIKSLFQGTIKISGRRILSLQQLLEAGEGSVSIDVLWEYMLMNKFVIDLVDKESYNEVMSLIKTRSKDNVIIGAHALYRLIEDKKQEIKDKLK